MEINNLKTFLSVAKYGSFRKAAEEFFLSPRAVSKQMDQLENELGIVLFNRSKNNSELTIEGKKFIIAAEDIVNTYNNELNRISNTKDQDKLLLHVGFSSANQEIELQHLLVILLKKYSGIKLDFVQESGRRLLKLIQTGALDFVISPFYDLPHNHDENLGQIQLRTGELLVGVSKLNSLSTQNVVNRKDLTNFNVYYYSPYESSFMRDVFLEKFPNEFTKERIKRCSSLELRDAYVATNHGIGFYPSPFLKLEKTRNLMIKFLSLSDTNNIFYSSSLFYKKNTHSKLVLKLIKDMQKSDYINQ